MNKILLVSDVLTDIQVNGVGVTILNRKKELERIGYIVDILDARSFAHTFPLPSYPEIRLTIATVKAVEQKIKACAPDYIHIETEGTLGLLVRTLCKRKKWKYTTSYHTRFPEYISMRVRSTVFESSVYAYQRWFHKAGISMFVSTQTLQEELECKGFKNGVVVPLGVDTVLFTKNKDAVCPLELTAPIFVYFGRIAVEKNLKAFLEAQLPGSKLIIGDGPERILFEEKFADSAHFVGYKTGQELVDLLSIAHVCVFPSKTDTFGLSILEALACELPVVAFDVQGPKNIITNGHDGFCGDCIDENAITCLTLDTASCRSTAEKYSWKYAIEKFVTELVPR